MSTPKPEETLFDDPHGACLRDELREGVRPVLRLGLRQAVHHIDLAEQRSGQPRFHVPQEPDASPRETYSKKKPLDDDRFGSPDPERLEGRAKNPRKTYGSSVCPWRLRKVGMSN